MKRLERFEQEQQTELFASNLRHGKQYGNQSSAEAGKPYEYQFAAESLEP